MSNKTIREALEFYADPTRYHGPNQRNDRADKWSGGSPYIHDVTRDGGAIAREALAQAEQRGDSPEDQAEQFIRAAIDRAPEPLRRLGEYLTQVLDEDEWKTAESMLLGAAEKAAQADQRGEVVASVEDSLTVRAAFEDWLAWWSTLPSDRGEHGYRDMTVDMLSYAYAAGMKRGAKVENRGDAVPIKQFRVKDAAAWNDGIPPTDHYETRTLYTVPPAPVVPDEVAKDAARYRWIRDSSRVPSDSTGGHIVVCDESGEDVLWGSALDRSIDSAMLADAPAVDATGKSGRSNRRFLTPDWIEAEDAAGGVMAAGALAAPAAPPAPVVPEGWKLVPSKPTAAMRAAYNDACKAGKGEAESWLVDAGYRAMLAAAPAAPEVPRG